MMDAFEERYGEFRRGGFNDPRSDLGSYYKARRFECLRNSAQNVQKMPYIQPELHKLVVNTIDDVLVISDYLVYPTPRRDC